MQHLAVIALATLIGVSSAFAQSSDVVKPIDNGIPPELKGVAGPLPVDPSAKAYTHPLGLWVLEGSECLADDMEAIQIDADTITLYDPTAHSGSFSTENGGSFEIVDLSLQTGPITLSEPTGTGHRLIAELPDGDLMEFTIELFPDQKATMTFPGDFQLELTGCDQS